VPANVGCSATGCRWNKNGMCQAAAIQVGESVLCLTFEPIPAPPPPPELLAGILGGAQPPAAAPQTPTRGGMMLG